MKAKNILILGLGLLAVISPFIFIWMSELIMVYGGGDLTNGFMFFDGLKVYHFWMYVVFASSIIVYFILINFLIGWEIQNATQTEQTEQIKKINQAKKMETGGKRK